MLFLASPIFFEVCLDLIREIREIVQILLKYEKKVSHDLEVLSIESTFEP